MEQNTKEYDGFPVYQIRINELDETGVDLISLVSDPAIEVDFFKFNKTPQKLRFDADKQFIVSPFLIPDKMIYRYDEKVGEYYTFFSAETIQLIQLKFSKASNSHSINFEHSDRMIDGYIVENWIKESDSDKSSAYGFGDLPHGTWFGKIKIEDSKFWDEVVKTGEVKGVSVEGIMSLHLSKDINPGDLIDEVLLSSIKSNAYGEKFELSEWEFEESEIDDTDLVDLQFMAGIGSKNAIESDSKEDSKNKIVRYKYSGPLDSKNRRFCHQMMQEDLYFTIEEINRLSFQVRRLNDVAKNNYSVFTYKGSYGCRHKWVKYTFLKRKDVISDAPGKAGVAPAQMANQKSIQKLSMFELKDGTAIYAETLEIGALVYSDEAMTMPMADGDYIMSDDRTMTILDGKVADIADAPATDSAPEDAPVEAATQLADERIAALEAKVNELMNKFSALPKPVNVEDVVKSVTALSDEKKATDKGATPYYVRERQEIDRKVEFLKNLKK